MENTNIKKEKVEKLLKHFKDLCEICLVLNIKKNEGLNNEMERMKKWIDENF